MSRIAIAIARTVVSWSRVCGIYSRLLRLEADPARAEEQGERCVKPKILVVDDERALTEAISIRLSAAGFVTLTANGADEASVIALHERPALILLDIDMPSYTGFEFQECLKFADRGKNIPVIMMSGLDTQVNRMLAFQFGATDFIRKPIEWSHLLKSIRGIEPTSTEASPAEHYS